MEEEFQNHKTWNTVLLVLSAVLANHICMIHFRTFNSACGLFDSRHKRNFEDQILSVWNERFVNYNGNASEYWPLTQQHRTEECLSYLCYHVEVIDLCCDKCSDRFCFVLKRA